MNLIAFPAFMCYNVGMKKSIKIYTAAAIAASVSLLTACSTQPVESAFENPRPWQDDISIARNGSYEKLDYAVTVYDTTAGVADDKRIAIAVGTMSFELTESIANEYTTLDMRFSVTYNDGAPEIDRGLTDTVSSTVRFSTGSLAAQYMQKTVTLADRAGVKNLSYTVTADYHGNQTATLTTNDQTEAATLPLSKNTCRDNEMMFYLARAQAIAPETSTMFRMINVYQSFVAGKTTEYTLYAQTSAEKTSVNIGDFVKDCGVAAVTDEATGEVSYPVSCYSVNIGRSGTEAGPPYNVLYSENAFTIGEKSHKKIPVKISYSEYKNNRAFRATEYVLSACSFDKNA